jgi:3-oxoadipate enol-lactonase
LKLLVEDVVGLMDALNIRSVHFTGLSMGGMIGQGLALDHADRVMSLVLCDTTSYISEEAQPMWQERFDAVRQEGLRALVDVTMERWFTPFFLRLNPPIVQKIRQDILNTPVDGYIGCGEAIRRLNYRDRLREISLPTLVLVGEDDPGTPVSFARAIHERIAESKLVILPSARHLSNVEQPEAFNTALLGFLRNL